MTSQLINGTVDVATSGILGDPGTDKWAMTGPLVKIVGTGWVASAGAHIFLVAKREARRHALAAHRFTAEDRQTLVAQ